MNKPCTQHPLGKAHYTCHNRRMKRFSGFSIVELLIVIAIIGVLVTIATLNFGLVRDNARDRIATADLEQVQLALSLYKEVHGAYPSANGVLDANDAAMTAIESDLYPQYLDELPSATPITFKSDLSEDEYCIGLALRREVNQPDFHYPDCLGDGSGVTLSVSAVGAPDADHAVTLGNHVP